MLLIDVGSVLLGELPCAAIVVCTRSAGAIVELALGDQVEHRVEAGSEAGTIVRLAEEAQASLVVIGTRRRGALKSVLAGSVSLHLRTSARRPVLLVPSGARLPLRT